MKHIRTYFYSSVIAVCIIMPLVPVSAATLCSTYTAATTPDSALGASYSLFSPGRPLLFRASCTQHQARLVVGNASEKFLVYGTAYMEFSPGDFTPVTFTAKPGDTAISSWIVTDTIVAAVPIPADAQGKTINAYAFICQVRSGPEGRSLKCGCNERSKHACLHTHGTHMGTWTHQRIQIPAKTEPSPAPPPEAPSTQEPIAGAHPDITKVLDIPLARIKLTPGPGWADSYSVGNRCYCTSTFDHGIGAIRVQTPVGAMTVRQACARIGAGPGKAGRPVYNDIQCGNGPPNDAGDEEWCPGRVDIGKTGCRHVGPTWKFD